MQEKQQDKQYFHPVALSQPEIYPFVTKTYEEIE
jgi:hypothetical protein